jgi:flagellar hook-associated protein 2
MTTPTVSTNSSGASVLSGLVSGIDTSNIIDELMEAAAAPQQELEQQESTAKTGLSSYQSINSALQTVQSDAQALALPTGWDVYAATSSTPATATATAGTGAASGSLTFTVNNLATSSSVVSSATVASTSTTVTSGNLLLSQAAGLGFSSLSGDQTLATGSHTLTVTQSSAGASVTGTSALAGSTTITTGSNDTLDYTLDGTSKTLTLAAGTYTASELAAEVAKASGGSLTAQVNGAGQLGLTTVDQGSAHSLTVNSGNALSALGLTSGQTGTGTDGVVNVDGGPSVTVSDASAGATISLTSATGGTIAATLAGGLVAGSSTLQNVSTNSGDLSDVVNAINSSGSGLTATAVQVGSSGYRLQINSDTTGAASQLTIDPSTFTGTLGQLNTLQAGEDATLTVGSGANAYQVTSASNNVTGVLPGVTIGLVSPSTDPVTVSVSTDTTALSAQVQQMVSDINTVITQAQTATAYNQSTATGGPLIGDPVVQGLAGGLISALTSPVAGNDLGNATAIGISVSTSGTISFDSSTFEAALAANPQEVASLFDSSGGIAQQLQTYADAMSNPVTGAVTNEINGSEANITNLGNQINAWTPILQQQQQQLTNQFNQMESTLSTLETQSSALSALGVSS